MTDSLAVVVPFRDREEHLRKFLPHLIEYFSRNPRLAPGKVACKIVEQESGKPFNRGMLLNIGFALAEEQTQGVCFHDVDYLPITADYRIPRKGWVSLVSKGPEEVVDPHGNKTVNRMEYFFGGAVLFEKAAFKSINGFSNSYWGWGSEDIDMHHRAQLVRLQFRRRGGEFRLLPHTTNALILVNGHWATAPLRLKNQQTLDSRFPPGLSPEMLLVTSQMGRDGLSSLSYKIKFRQLLSQYCTETVHVEKIIVSI